MIDVASLKLGKLATKDRVTSAEVKAYSLAAINLSDNIIQTRHLGAQVVTPSCISLGLIKDGLNTTVERNSTGIYRVNAQFTGVTSLNR